MRLLARMRISINRAGKEPYAVRIEILHIFTLLRFFGFSFCVFVVVFRLLGERKDCQDRRAGIWRKKLKYVEKIVDVFSFL